MDWNRLEGLARRGLVLFLAGAAAWKVLTVVLPWAAPFLLALVLAWLLEPAVRLLTRRLRLPRWVAAALSTALLAAALLGLGALALRRAYGELSDLAVRLPGWMAKLPVSDGRLEGWLYRVTMAAPAGYQSALAQLPERLLQGLNDLLAQLSAYVVSLSARLLSALPSGLLFSFTALLATYFISAARPRLSAGACALLPQRWRARLARGRAECLHLLWGWGKAQFTLLSVTFACLTLGLLLLRVKLALLLAVLIALVDALPILGAGTVLLPWGLFCLLAGETVRGVGLLALYGAITLLRSLLEPRLLGREMGLPPLAALAALYAGFSAFGAAGLLLAPPAAALLWGLCRAGAKKD
jgi:sporulation integral membrane protein YtvI